ncbi:MAG: hypothetical protein ABRQ38_30045 [Candidatus Eremiobacterota bacterium]
MNQSFLNITNMVFNINMVSRNLLQTVENEFYNVLIFLKIDFIRPPPVVSALCFDRNVMKK